MFICKNEPRKRHDLLKCICKLSESILQGNKSFLSEKTPFRKFFSRTSWEASLTLQKSVPFVSMAFEKEGVSMHLHARCYVCILTRKK